MRNILISLLFYTIMLTPSKAEDFDQFDERLKKIDSIGIEITNQTDRECLQNPGKIKSIAEKEIRQSKIVLKKEWPVYIDLVLYGNLLNSEVCTVLYQATLYAPIGACLYGECPFNSIYTFSIENRIGFVTNYKSQVQNILQERIILAVNSILADISNAKSG